jgi:cellulose synthase/poly-beta-1,6-N-acetylglucosamine synthase-like glycosyltransferase
METLRQINELDYGAIKVAHTSEEGVVAAMNVGIAASKGDIVAILDDDAYPRQDWLKRIEAAFSNERSIVGVGGIDLQKKPGQMIPKNKRMQVGIISWLGRLHGNHHLGKGHARPVHVLKGCNCAYKGEFLRRVKIDTCLRGVGAQVGWEIALGFDAMKEGGVLIYDPEIVVDHLVAPRIEGDNIHRGEYNSDAAYDIAWNQFSILKRKAPAGLRLRILFWDLTVGSTTNPGVLRLFDWRIGNLAERIRRIGLTFSALQNAGDKVTGKESPRGYRATSSARN